MILRSNETTPWQNVDSGPSSSVAELQELGSVDTSELLEDVFVHGNLVTSSGNVRLEVKTIPMSSARVRRATPFHHQADSTKTHCKAPNDSYGLYPVSTSLCLEVSHETVVETIMQTETHQRSESAEPVVIVEPSVFVTRAPGKIRVDSLMNLMSRKDASDEELRNGECMFDLKQRIVGCRTSVSPSTLAKSLLARIV